MISEIKITNSKSGVTTIDIEGTIGVPEEWQFEEPSGRIATYERFQASLAAIGKIRGGEIVVNIRSGGGDVGDALLIYDTLTALDGVITTRCWGYVASAATIIAQAAGERRREISANSLYLIHNAVAGCEGNARDFRQSEELLSKTDERIASIYATRSGREPGEFLALMSENNGSGRWLSPGEALAAGLCDRIIDAAPVTAEDPSSECAPVTVRRSFGERIASLARMLAGEKPAVPVGVDPMHRQQDVELEKLRHRITTLESENAQLRARPTETRPQEDPSPTESRRSANENAYARDVESFLR